MLPARPRLSLLLENFGLLFVFTRSLRTRERNGISARIHSQSSQWAMRSLHYRREIQASGEATAPRVPAPLVMRARRESAGALATRRRSPDLPPLTYFFRAT